MPLWVVQVGAPVGQPVEFVRFEPYGDLSCEFVFEQGDATLFDTEGQARAALEAEFNPAQRHAFQPAVVRSRWRRRPAPARIREIDPQTGKTLVVYDVNGGVLRRYNPETGRAIPRPPRKTAWARVLRGFLE